MSYETSSAEQAPSEHEQATEKAAAFLREQLPALSNLTGLAVNVAIGKGWATNLETGDFTIDPSFFIEKGYSAEHCTYAALHELMAHVRDVKLDPVYAARQREFTSTRDRQLAQARHLFNNILTDIHGNKFTHALLPAMKDVGADIYETRLFAPEVPGEPVEYTDSQPLHFQFLYKIIRQEMIPDSVTHVRDEVDAAIARLRDYEGTGFDIVTYLTDPNKKLSGSDRFDQQLATIWPEYEQLLELAKQEVEDNQQRDGKNGEQSSEQNQGESQDGEPQPGPFDDAYQDYFNNKHPEPMSEEEHDKLDEAIKNAAKKEQQKQQDATKTPEQRTKDKERERQRHLDRTLREQTGHSLAEHQAYNAERDKWLDTISHMREVFRAQLSEVVAVRRGLSRRAHTDGDVLDPRRLAQTITDIKSGVAEPEAFQRYEHVRGRTKLAGKREYIFAFDCSGSMQGEPAEATAACSIIMLEALAGMERDIRATETEFGIDLSDFEIRTALYVFGNTVRCIKPLGSSLSDRERIDAYQACQKDMGGTQDFLALEEIAALPLDDDRERTVTVLCDGQSEDPERARRAIRTIRHSGANTFGITLGPDADPRQYAPHTKHVDSPSHLPKAMQTLIEEGVKRAA